jgi:hypothetical protein
MATPLEPNMPYRMKNPTFRFYHSDRLFIFPFYFVASLGHMFG